MSWRKRSCPECGYVDDAGNFRWIKGGSWGSDARRACPDCRHEGPTSSFRVVDELKRRPRTIEPRGDMCITCGEREDLVLVAIRRGWGEDDSTVDVASCKVHDDPGVVEFWYDEWASSARWRNRQ